MESLQGNFLVATNRMRDPRFRRCVILICFHSSSEGAMGLVVNQPLADVSLRHALRGIDFTDAALELPPVYLGGPVEVESAFILHSAEYVLAGSKPVLDQVYLSSDPLLLLDVARGRGPRQCRLLVGYAGWGVGQLEQELGGEGWLTLPAAAEDLFHIPAPSMWKEVTAKHGIDMDLYADISGNA
jgi:putative transcriptional regulator